MMTTEHLGVTGPARLEWARKQAIDSAGGPYCPFCHGARAEWLRNPETFDIHEHAQKCRARIASAKVQA